MTKINSPYADSVCLISPDGKFTATIREASETRMGGPSFGTFEISDGASYEGCNTSIVWSDDSRYLAVAQLTSYNPLRLLVISVEEKRFGYAPGFFGLLELHSFSHGKIKGIESPGSREQHEIEVDISRVRWK